jgi:hypothetical protein
MKDLKKIMRKMEDAFTAVSFAEAGEAETAVQMLGEERRVLLAVKERGADAKTLRYALNTCKRIKANLDILLMSPLPDTDPLMERFLSGLKGEGVLYRLVRQKGCMKQAIIDYTNARRDILFVVIESSDTLDVDCPGKGRSLSEAWNSLRCPLVVVSEGAKA